MSESVSKALTLLGGAKVSETARFASMMDKFFDALNASIDFTNGKHKRKPFQNPYRSADDFRIAVSRTHTHTHSVGKWCQRVVL